MKKDILTLTLSEEWMVGDGYALSPVTDTEKFEIVQSTVGLSPIVLRLESPQVGDIALVCRFHETAGGPATWYFLTGVVQLNGELVFGFLTEPEKPGPPDEDFWGTVGTGIDWRISMLTGEIRLRHETDPAFHFRPNDPLYLWVVANSPSKDELSAEICRRLREGGFGFIADNWPRSPNPWSFLREVQRVEGDYQRLQKQVVELREQLEGISNLGSVAWNTMMHPKDENGIVGDLRALMGSDGAIGNTAKKVCVTIKSVFAPLGVNVEQR